MFDFDFSDPDEPPKGYCSVEDTSSCETLTGFKEGPHEPVAMESKVNNRLEDDSDDEPLIGFEEVPCTSAPTEGAIKNGLEDVFRALSDCDPPHGFDETGQEHSTVDKCWDGGKCSGKVDVPTEETKEECEGTNAATHSVKNPIAAISVLLSESFVTISPEVWHASAKAFGDMILSFQRVNCIAGRGWFEGIHKLLLGTENGDWTFGDFAGRLLRNSILGWSSPHNWAASYRKLYIRLEVKVAEATRNLDPACDWTSRRSMFDDRFIQVLKQEGFPTEAPFAGYGQRSLLFIGLPLCMYVSDCSHLYVLVRRLRSLRILAAKGRLTAESISAALNADNKPYAVLMFAILAALQALHSARMPGKSKQGAAGLEALSASAVPSVRSKFGANSSVSVASDHFNKSEQGVGPGASLGRVSGSNALIFRGIWLKELVEEDSVAYTWSLNSFSRSLEGANWVLDYYATDASDFTARAIAQKYGHAFYYVGRFYTETPELVFPVQFFSSGMCSDIEKEVLVPPFVHYAFETFSDKGGEEATVSNTMSPELRSRRIMEVERRWGINLSHECPLLLRMLFATPAETHNYIPGLKRLNMTVTVGFIRNIVPSKPIQDIFGAPNQPPEDLLLAFPADGNICDHRFGAGDRDLLDTYENLLSKGTSDDKEQGKRDAMKAYEHWSDS